MNEVFTFLLSPWGIAAYAAFWALKLTFGVWVLSKLLPLLPLRLRRRVRILSAQPRYAVARLRSGRRI